MFQNENVSLKLISWSQNNTSCIGLRNISLACLSVRYWEFYSL